LPAAAFWGHPVHVRADNPAAFGPLTTVRYQSVADSKVRLS
jgi:hypothetical protein